MHHFQFGSRLFILGPIRHWYSLWNLLLRLSINLFFTTLSSTKTYRSSLATWLERIFYNKVINSNNKTSICIPLIMVLTKKIIQTPFFLCWPLLAFDYEIVQLFNNNYQPTMFSAPLLIKLKEIKHTIPVLKIWFLAICF